MQIPVRIALIHFVVAAVLTVPLTRAQQASAGMESASPRASYVFDPLHATMTASPGASFALAGKLESNAATAPSVTHTGTVVVIFTVKLISPLPEGAVLRCGGNAGLEYFDQEQVTPNVGVGFFVTLSASETVSANVSAGTATCRLNLPYSWTLPASTDRNMITIRGISGSIGISETMVDPTGKVNTVVTLRSTTTALTGPPMPPPDGDTVVMQASTVL